MTLKDNSNLHSQGRGRGTAKREKPKENCTSHNPENKHCAEGNTGIRDQWKGDQMFEKGPYAGSQVNFTCQAPLRFLNTNKTTTAATQSFHQVLLLKRKDVSCFNL